MYGLRVFVKIRAKTYDWLMFYRKCNMGKDLEYRGRSSDYDKNTLLERIILYFNDKIIDIDNDLSMINLVLGLFMMQIAI